MCHPESCKVCDRPECEGPRQYEVKDVPRHPEDDRLRRLEARVVLLEKVVSEQLTDFLCNFVADCEADLEDAKACVSSSSSWECPFRSECEWALNLSAQLEQITK